jgi:hypothetical protein
MSTPGSEKTFEDQLRDKLAGHEYEYHPSEWAGMQQKLNAYAHAANAAKTAVLKKTLFTAGKITGGLVSAGAIIYTALSLAGVVDRADLGFGDKDITTPLMAKNEVSDNRLTKEAHVNREEKEDRLLTKDSKRSNIKRTTYRDLLVWSEDEVSREDMKILWNSLNNPGLLKINPLIGSQWLAQNESVDFLNKRNGEIEENSLTKSKTEGNETVSEVTDTDKKDSTLKGPVNPFGSENGKYSDKETEKPFRIHAGIIGGASIAPVFTGNADEQTKLAPGLNMIGAFVSLPINAKLTVQSGVQFRNQHNWDIRQKTSQVQYGVVQDSTLTEYNLRSGQYLELPLTIKYAVDPRFHLTAGIKVNWLQSTHGTLNEVSYHNNKYEGYHNREIYAHPQGLKTWDINLSGGVEYKLNKLLSIGGTYQYGIMDIARFGAATTALRNSYLQAYAAVKLY